MTKPFRLHPQLEHDCIDIGRFDLCRLLMMNDSLYPWFILVPEKHGITEIYQLNPSEQNQLIKESGFLAENLAELFRADKMNIAAIGNLVPQLHIHHIVRYKTDKAWPAPVWGKFERIPYTEVQIKDNLVRLKDRLKNQLQPTDTEPPERAIRR
ncbi:MAG: HIT domain-containing protein [Gammaproteobacteria bacterium]